MSATEPMGGLDETLTPVYPTTEGVSQTLWRKISDQAIKQAGICIDDISAIAFTRGPGLLGSLLVGVSFAKSFDYLNAIDKTIVSYLDYDPLMNENQLKSALAHYPNFKLGENLEINKFPLDYRR